MDRIEVVASCSNAIEAFNVINSNQIDLVFLDINMPDISGLSFAKSINKDIKVIFTTAYREYAIDGFNLEAVDYLLKPISYERLYKSLNKYFEVYLKDERLQKEDPLIKENNYIFVKADRKMVKIDFSEIMYVESLSDYIQIHTTNNTITARETISNIEAKLPTANFLRIHRSFIVSINHIKSYTNEFIEVSNKALPISRSYKQTVLSKLG
jgi:DNA-binding LytR/AlgR family response regulator